ncbi:hypothetical protein ROZALSC1DRAFT_30510, partial [Rozella allomycis CSF55]
MHSRLYTLTSQGYLTRRLESKKKRLVKREERSVDVYAKKSGGVKRMNKLNVRAENNALVVSCQNNLERVLKQLSDAEIMNDEFTKVEALENVVDCLFDVNQKLENGDSLFLKKYSFHTIVKLIFNVLNKIDESSMSGAIVKEASQLFATINVRLIYENEGLRWLLNTLLSSTRWNTQRESSTISSKNSAKSKSGSMMYSSTSINGMNGRNSVNSNEKMMNIVSNNNVMNVGLKVTNSSLQNVPNMFSSNGKINNSNVANNKINSRRNSFIVGGGPIQRKKLTDVILNEDNMISGLLRNYMESSFLDDLEKMGKEQRKDVVKNLLLLFCKVGKLLSATNFISVELNLHSALNKIVKEAASILESERGGFYFVDMNCKEIKGIDCLINENFVKFPIGSGVCGQVALKNEAIILSDVNKSPYFNSRVDGFPDLTVNSMICMPAKSKDGNIEGVLFVVNKENGFLDEDVFLLKHLALQVGIVIGNTRSYETIKNTQKKVEVLLGTTKSLSSELELEKLIQAIMQAAKDLLGADRCTLYLIDQEKRELWSQVQGRNGIQEIRFSMNVGLSGFVASTGQTLNIPDAYKDPRFNPLIDKQTGYRTKTMLCMPIKNTSGVIIGVTQMINKLNGTFGPEDEQLLSAFSSQAAVAIEKSYLFRKTEEMKNHLESILESITDCVLTLSDSGHLISINHNWLIDALGEKEEDFKSLPVDSWLGKNNPLFLKDVRYVYKNNSSVSISDYELKSSLGSTKFVNYKILPLVGITGVVIVIEDVSEERRMMTTLGRYMSPALVKQVMAEGGSQLGGTRINVSVLFSDIRSFTNIAESMPPSQVVELLNRHFSDAVNAITSEQGVLDKFIGDACMAVFGVPFPQPSDPINACNAALKMQQAMDILNEENISAGKQTLKIGIGINSGEVLSGNIGSEKRMDYTVIGDNVNLASRIESLTKYYGVSILISDSTFNEIKQFESNESNNFLFLTREIDKVKVVGKSTACVIYQLYGKHGDDIPPQKASCYDKFVNAKKLYYQRKFDQALSL